jgi:probable addiction module antidote protein
MLKEKTTEFKVSDYLNTEDEIIEYLRLSLEEDTPEMLMYSIANVLKSKGYSKIAKDTGITREGLYKSFSGKTKPKFETIYKIIDSLGFKFSILPKNNKKKLA